MREYQRAVAVDAVVAAAALVAVAAVAVVEVPVYVGTAVGVAGDGAVDVVAPGFQLVMFFFA